MVLIDPAGAVRSVRFAPVLTRVEDALIPRNNCGANWLQALRFEARGSR